uniref:Uncharacterized protein n=1 Tax=Cajanus cajan TaxID=3821 RepID=A0A151U320_CAJCA|nr:hypothetical protein KK1_006341 [Cajanus cajan]
MVGKPIKVDMRTINASCGKFARVCIEIDLNQLVMGKFWLSKHWFHVEYECLCLIYKRCDKYGHIACCYPDVKIDKSTRRQLR